MRTFWIFLVCTVFSNRVLLIKRSLKPSFYPYCSQQARCTQACNCEIFPNCKLLAMDQSIRSSILYYHNQIRNVQIESEPRPAAMTLLDYDMELEEISMCWAARCEDVYSDCFISTRFAETSQSVVQVVVSEKQPPSVFLWMQVMNEWLREVRNLPVEYLQSVPGGEEGGKIHNYVQVISDRILGVGCAWSSRDDMLTLVCTYGPRGARQDEAIYGIGFPCSLCPGGYACDYTKPFELLCKLRIYSVAPSQTELLMPYATPPLIPPYPSSTENDMEVTLSNTSLDRKHTSKGTTVHRSVSDLFPTHPVTTTSIHTKHPEQRAANRVMSRQYLVFPLVYTCLIAFLSCELV